MNLSAFLGAVLFFILLSGSFIYKAHPEAFQDAIADLTNDPNGVRAQLAKLRHDKVNPVQNGNPSADATVAVTPAITNQPSDASSSPDNPLIFVPPNPLPAQPDWTWTTPDGAVYKNVLVQSVDADCVTILHSNGGARVDIALLPVDVQKRLNFNPVLARQAAEKRAKELAASEQASDVEKQAIHQKQQAQNHLGIDQEQAYANMQKTVADAERKGQIVSLSIQIDDLKAKIATTERFMQNPMDTLAYHAYKADLKQLTELQVNLAALKKEAKEAKETDATAAK